MDALENGQELGKEVFAPQPPGFYLLLRLISLAGADTVRGFHIGMVVVAVATCFAAYLVARSVAGPIAGLTASALLTVAPPFPLYAFRVLADIPPLAACLVALWLAWEASTRRSSGLAFASGAAFAGALALKPTAALALPPLLILLLWHRSGLRRAAASAAAGTAVVAATFFVAYRDSIPELWESVVVYHRKARATPAVIDKADALLTFLNWRTPFAWLFVAGVAATIVLVRRRYVPQLWALWLWAGLSLAFLVYHHPLHDNHLLVLPVALSVPAGVALGALATKSRRPWLAAGALALVLAAAYVQQQRRVAVAITPEEPELVLAAERLAQVTRPDDLVVSDHSIVPFLADRRVYGPLVDTAVLRFQTGSLTSAGVLRDLEAGDVRAVVVGRAFASEPELIRGLERRYSRRLRVGGLTIYTRR